MLADRSTSGHCGNQYGNVVVQVRQVAIESRQLAVAASCELSTVSIGHLSTADDTSKLHIGERHTVRPEVVTIRTLDCTDDIARSHRQLLGLQQESNKTSLRDWARRKSCIGCRQPFCRRIVMYVVRDDERSRAGQGQLG